MLSAGTRHAGAIGVVIWAMLPVVPVALAQSAIFDIGSSKASQAVFAHSEQAVGAGGRAWLGKDPQFASPMLDEIDGVIGRLDGKEIDALRRCAGAVVQPPREAGVRMAVVHLFSPPPTDAEGKYKTVEIVRQADGSWLAHELHPTPSPRAGQPDVPARWAALKAEFVTPLALRWAAYRGGWPEGMGGRGGELAAQPGDSVRAPAAGVVFELGRPYTQGLFTMTKATLGERLRAGGTTDLEGTTRVLGDDAIFARLPAGWTAHDRPGLLVFVHAMDDGRPPPVFFAACDELGLIVAGASNSGNDRPAADRYQLALDVVATVSARFLVDPDRVYITGISGGGKVSSNMLGGWPDVFCGAAPIVGLATYKNVPTGEGAQFWPAHFSKPKPALFNLLKARRLAAVTGDKDFNHAPIVGAIDVYIRDGCAAKLFDYPGMGHEFPTAERLAEVMRWVDEPAHAALEQRRTEARAAWAKFEALRPDPAVALSSADRAELTRITRLYPWTEEAWRAAGALRK